VERGSCEGDCKMKRKDFVAWEQSLDGPTILTDVERVCAQLKIAGEDRDNDDEPVLPAPGKVVAHLHNAQRCQERRAALQAENAELRAFITHQGFQRCDVPTCNCGSYHGGHAFARFHEIGEALVEAGARSNGSTVLTDVKRVLTENVELVAALTKSEQPGGCIISRTAPIAHCCKNCDALLLLARLAMKESKT